jgi:hypothetical protein
MAFEVADRIQETSTTTGTGTYSLDGAATGFQAFSVLGASSITGYFATDDTNWEVGIGTVATGPATLARTTVLASSNSGSAVNWGAGTRRIYCGLPAAFSPRKEIAARSSNTILGAADFHFGVVATSTFTQTFSAAATLGDGWFVDYRNDGTGIITLDPDGAELINGAATLKLYPGESCRILCNGSAFKALFLSTGDVVIGTATASASSSIDFTTGIDSNFERYELEFAGVVPGTTGVNLMLRVSQGGTFNGTTDYAYTGVSNNDGGAVSAIGGTGQTSIVVANNAGTTAGNSINGRARFWNPAGTTQYKQFGFETTYPAAGVVTTYYAGNGKFVANTAAIDGARFILSAGNIASGTFTLRGYRRG